jgi:hypothetical protein
LFFCAFLQNINKYIPVAVPGKIEFEEQFPQRFVCGNPADFLVFGFLGRYCYEIVFQVDVYPFQVVDFCFFHVCIKLTHAASLLKFWGQ